MDDIYSNSNNNNGNDIYSDSSGVPQDRRPGQPQQRPPQQKPPQKKKGSNKKVVAFLIAMIVLLCCGFGVVYKLFWPSNVSESGRQNEHVSDANLFRNDNVFNVMVLGVDRRGNEKNTRSDTMILISLDKNNKKIKMTSFMRDMWVTIPGKGEAKLNAACFYGGPELALNTIEYNFNIKIDKYVLVDFNMFTKAIDTLGGLDLPLTKKEAAEIARYSKNKVKLEPGDSVHMDGEAALLFARIRKQDSDFQRTSRQRMVINAVMEKAKKESLTKLLKLATDNLKDVETDLTAGDLTILAKNAATSYIRFEVEEARIPADGMYKSQRVKGQAAIVPDLAKNKTYLKDFIYAIDSEDETTTKKK